MQPEVVGFMVALVLGVVKIVQFWIYWEFKKED